MKLNLSRQIFEKYLDTKFHKKNCPVGAEFFHAERRTDGQDRTDNRFLRFCERAYNWLAM
jgi:hypothetical protein